MTYPNKKIPQLQSVEVSAQAGRVWSGRLFKMKFKINFLYFFFKVGIIFFKGGGDGAGPNFFFVTNLFVIDILKVW